MGDVVSLKSEKDEPHIAGTGCCMVCLYEWAAVAPVGTHELECPRCGTINGVWKHPALPTQDDLVWVCSCRNYFFTILKSGAAMCGKCGKTQTW